MLSNIGPVQLLIILAIVLAIFGTKRLRTLGSDLGSAVKGFRSAVNDADQANDTDDAQGTAEKIAETSEDANFDNTSVEETQKENDA